MKTLKQYLLDEDALDEAKRMSSGDFNNLLAFAQGRPQKKTKGATFVGQPTDTRVGLGGRNYRRSQDYPDGHPKRQEFLKRQGVKVEENEDAKTAAAMRLTSERVKLHKLKSGAKGGPYAGGKSFHGSLKIQRQMRRIAKLEKEFVKEDTLDEARSIGGFGSEKEFRALTLKHHPNAKFRREQDSSRDMTAHIPTPKPKGWVNIIHGQHRGKTVAYRNGYTGSYEIHSKKR